MNFYFCQVFREIEVKGFDGSLFQTTQVFYSSKDGTKIPMFIIHRKVSLQCPGALVRAHNRWYMYIFDLGLILGSWGNLILKGGLYSAQGRNMNLHLIILKDGPILRGGLLAPIVQCCWKLRICPNTKFSTMTIVGENLYSIFLPIAFSAVYLYNSAFIAYGGRIAP